MAPRIPPSLTIERGVPGVTSINGYIDNWEETQELRWPLSMMVYDRMGKTDGQTSSTLRAIGLPIRRATWRVPKGGQVDTRVRDLVEVTFGLQVDDQGRRRRARQGISFDEHIRHALLMLRYGHMPFEQVYDLGPPPPGITGVPPVIGNLHKLSPRMPRTLTGIDVERDGGLQGIRQLVPDVNGFLREEKIGVESLVMYVNEKEGADWLGTSLLRSAYKNWLIKDQLLRLSAQAAERNSMGLPVVGFGAGGTRGEALRIGRRIRAGEDAAVAVPDGYTFKLQAVEGERMDLLPLIEYHNQEIGRNALAMFLNLGHDGGLGQGSLGDTFVDFFNLAEWALVAELEEYLTEYAVRDFVALNFGPDEPYPTIVADEIEPGGTLTSDAIATLVTAGVLTADDDLEDWIRRRGGAPPALRPPGGVGPVTPILPPGQPDPAALPPGPGDNPALPPGGRQPVKPDAVIPRGQRTAAAGRTVEQVEARLEQLRHRLEARRRIRRADAPLPV
jgi:hypothetical protein